MKIKTLILSSIAIVAIVGLMMSIGFKSSKPNYEPRKLQDMVHTQGIKGAVQWLNTIKGNPELGYISDNDVLSAREEVMKFISRKTNKAPLGIKWYEMGPDNVGGRCRALLIDRNNSEKLYAGGVAGGLWVSASGGLTWKRVDGFSDSSGIAISCIAQAPNGTIYVGTGEGLAQPGGLNINSGQIGNGVYKSTDGITFTQITSTKPAYSPLGITESPEWSTINRLACNQNNRVFAAYNKGLKYSDDGGNTWTYSKYSNGATLTNLSGKGTDIKIGSNGIIVYTQFVGSNGKLYISSDGNVDNFIQKTTGATNLLPTDMGRIEVAIAPSNPDIIYAVAAKTDGTLYNIYQSKDAGNSWRIVCPGGSASIDIFRNQGWYDNVAAVHPTNPNRIFVGGIDMWEGIEVSSTQPFSWTQKSLWYANDDDDEDNDIFYVHADHHAYVFHPTNPNIMYTGTDGGVSKTTNCNETFFAVNKNFNVTQFYAVACANDHRVMGGTQDNGTQYITLKGNTIQNAIETKGGDGGHSAFSVINPKAYFASTYYGDVLRSADNGASTENTSKWFDLDMLDADGFLKVNASFVTPTLVWENFNDYDSPDSVNYIAKSNIVMGQPFKASSINGRYPIKNIAPYNLNIGDTIKVQDIVQHKFYLGVENAVWMTRDGIKFAERPEWSKICNISGVAQYMATSKDGNNLFVGTQSGKLYRVSNLKATKDSANTDVNSSGCVLTTTLIEDFGNRTITSIAVDWHNPNRVVVTLGNFGSGLSYISYSDNALDADPTFTSKQGNLPKIPVYSAVIELSHPNYVIIGTEYGIYTTENITASSPTWTDESKGFGGLLPVYMLKQQTMFIPQDTGIAIDDEGNIVQTIFPGVTNCGYIYAATHGRGIFYCNNYYQPNAIADNTYVSKPNISIFPNPVTEYANISFNLQNSSNVVIKVYDLKGSIVKDIKLGTYSPGTHKYTINCEDLKTGAYIVNFNNGTTSSSSKFIVNK